MRVPAAVLTAVILVGATLASACHAGNQEQKSGTASDEWVRTYPLEKNGEFDIVHRNGAIEIESVEGSTIEVRAERVARAGSEKAARDILQQIQIQEDVLPAKVVVRTRGIEGIVIGVSFDVTYHVKVPAWAMVRATTTNGNLVVKGLSGRLVASASNGNLITTDLRGGVDARSTNGSAIVDLAALGEDPVTVRTTNGALKFTVPETAAANVLATTVNGEVTITGVTFEPIGEQQDGSRGRGRQRRIRGKLNAGGVPIELQTVNGDISIAARTK